MCGLVTILNIDPTRSNSGELRKLALSMAKKIRHRGPDWSGIYSDERAILAHERLSIVDVEHGAQPLVDTLKGSVLAVNGEIYNHKDLRRELKHEHDFQTASDCEVILYLYDELPPKDFLNRMNGIFGFVLYDPKRESFLIARDPIGVIAVPESEKAIPPFVTEAGDRARLNTSHDSGVQSDASELPEAGIEDTRRGNSPAIGGTNPRPICA